MSFEVFYTCDKCGRPPARGQCQIKRIRRIGYVQQHGHMAIQIIQKLSIERGKTNGKHQETSQGRGGLYACGACGGNGNSRNPRWGGIVAYSGYVQKANETLDEQLLSEIKYAGQLGAAGGSTASGAVYVTTSGAYSSGSDEVSEWMVNAFGNDWNSTVAYLTEKYATEQGLIILPSGDTYQLKESYLAAAAAWSNSNYADSEEQLLGQVGSLVDAAAALLGGKVSLYWSSYEELQEWLDEQGLSASDLDGTGTANLLVLAIASQAEEAGTIIGKTFSGEELTAEEQATWDEMNNDPITMAALYYGLAVAYANSDCSTDAYKQQASTTPSDLTEVYQLINAMQSDSGFYQYTGSGDYTNSEFLSDTNAYLGALTILWDNKDSIDITSASAYDNEYVLSMLQAYMNAAG
ncbi:MAG: hypothetical protein LUC19_02670 [Oscillospiraceae bacterium]|nr:hypothetical protein [Oscillospiraceae bacterium]